MKPRSRRSGTGYRDSEPLEQRSQRSLTQPCPCLGNRAIRRDRPIVRPIPKVTQTVDEFTQHFLVGIFKEQTRRENEVHHHARRQQTRSLLLLARLPQHLIHHITMKYSSQHTNADAVGEPPRWSIRHEKHLTRIIAQHKTTPQIAVTKRKQ